jgi:hypothetical protein
MSKVSKSSLEEIRLERKISQSMRSNQSATLKPRKENIEPYTNNKIAKLYKFLDECEKQSDYQASLTTGIDY